MAHFAQIDAENKVTQVIVINNSEIIDEDGLENETLGIEFCKTLFGSESQWLQTSYNNKIRKQYAGIGYSYNETLDMFIIPKCHDEAVLNELGDWDCDNSAHGEVI